MSQFRICVPVLIPVFIHVYLFSQCLDVDSVFAIGIEFTSPSTTCSAAKHRDYLQVCLSLTHPKAYTLLIKRPTSPSLICDPVYLPVRGIPLGRVTSGRIGMPCSLNSSKINWPMICLVDR